MSLFYKSPEKVFELEIFPSIDEEDQKARNNGLHESACSINAVNSSLRKSQPAFASFNAASCSDNANDAGKEERAGETCPQEQESNCTDHCSS